MSKRRKRRIWSDKEKQAICGQTRVKGVSVSQVARPSETTGQLQLALEASEIAAAKMTARLRLPDEEPKNKPKRRPIPDHIPRQEIELTTGDDDCAHCGGALRRLGEDGEPCPPLVRGQWRARSWSMCPVGSS